LSLVFDEADVVNGQG